ncbi:MAG: hypothetical protein L0312_23350 [Acidobacteria bacterium]|nr:hypothetical protein [Acidobacteriota bacterium]
MNRWGTWHTRPSGVGTSCDRPDLGPSGKKIAEYDAGFRGKSGATFKKHRIGDQGS